MATELKPGDIVQLRSGGPRMTVESIDNYSYSGTPEMKARCTWFEGTKRQEALFVLAALEKV
jgi:uncharacterized protein YodC (DUF2158 family)